MVDNPPCRAVTDLPAHTTANEFVVERGSAIPCMCSELPDRASFLGLPQELRDIIYAFALERVATPPPNPSFPGPRVSPAKDSAASNRLFKQLHFTSDSLPNPRKTFLSLSRSIKVEVEDYLVRQPSIWAELDVMVKGHSYFPTWTRLPCAVPHNQPVNLTVNLRMFSSEAFVPPPHSDDASSGVGVLLFLFTQFLGRGPLFGRSPSQRYRHGRGVVSVNRLAIVVSNHDPYGQSIFNTGLEDLRKNLRRLADRGDMQRYVKHIDISYRDIGTVLSELVGFREEIEVSATRNSEEVHSWRNRGYWPHPSDRIVFAGQENDVERHRNTLGEEV